MNGILAASALFLAGGLSSVTLGMAPLHGVLNEALWTGMALAGFLAIVGLEAQT
jgi:hypothetical protein